MPSIEPHPPPLRPNGGASGHRVARWQRAHAQWQHNYEQARPQLNNLRLPNLLDERPKPWMTRSLFDDTIPDIEEPDPGPPERELLHQLLSEATQLRIEVGQEEAALQGDVEMRMEGKVRKQAVWEAARQRVPLELEEAEERAAQAEEALCAAFAVHQVEKEQAQAACRPFVQKVHRARKALAEEEAEQAMLEGKRAEFQAERESEEKLVEELQRAIAANDSLLQAAEVERAESLRAQKSQAISYKWAYFSDAALSFFQQRVLEVEELELKDSAQATAEHADQLKEQRYAEGAAADRHGKETDKLRQQAATLQIETERLLEEMFEAAKRQRRQSNKVSKAAFRI